MPKNYSKYDNMLHKELLLSHNILSLHNQLKPRLYARLTSNTSFQSSQNTMHLSYDSWVSLIEIIQLWLIIAHLKCPQSHLSC